MMSTTRMNCFFKKKNSALVVFPKLPVEDNPVYLCPISSSSQATRSFSISIVSRCNLSTSSCDVDWRSPGFPGSYQNTSTVYLVENIRTSKKANKKLQLDCSSPAIVSADFHNEKGIRTSRFGISPELSGYLLLPTHFSLHL